jgi:hypothetical protein
MSPAQRRVMQYMRDTGCALIKPKHGAAWTHDRYCWTVQTSTFEALRAADRIKQKPTNELSPDDGAMFVLS